jgi:hypothetical protein
MKEIITEIEIGIRANANTNLGDSIQRYEASNGMRKLRGILKTVSIFDMCSFSDSSRRTGYEPPEITSNKIHTPNRVNPEMKRKETFSMEKRRRGSRSSIGLMK